MKKVLAALLFVSTTTFASDYVNLSVDQKDKVNSQEVHQVNRINLGRKFDNGLVVEGRMEDEKVDKGDGTQKQEGLGQVKVSYDIATGTLVTPYVAAAVGHKNKATIDFNFWLAEVGAKVKLGDASLRYGFRRRTAFDNNTTNAYDTNEQTVALGYNLTKNDNISIAYKQERNNDGVSSEYNTKGIYFTHSF